MSTTESRDAARALFDALIGGALSSMKVASAKLSGAHAEGPELQSQIAAALPPDSAPMVGRFLMGLAAAQKLDQLPAIVKAFERYTQVDGAALLDAQVTSAVELNDEQRQRIATDLRSRYGEQVRIEFDVDQSLIGGLIVRVGDQVLDNSLRTRLSVVQRNMTAS